MTGIPSMTPQAASANNWVRQVSVSGDPEADAYAALVEIYSLFGLPESAIPYAEGASVSIEKLRVV
jgi:hypothetical protein